MLQDLINEASDADRAAMARAWSEQFAIGFAKGASLTLTVFALTSLVMATASHVISKR